MGDLIAGVSYYPDHWPQADWARDLQNIKRCGMDCVRFGEFSWGWFEPEDGRFDFESYDRFMDLAHACGLGVILCTPTAAPPQWLLKAHPQARWVDANGAPHRGGRHMVRFSDPDFRRLAQRAILTLAERYKDHPALVGWQIDNEPTLGERVGGEVVYDYSPASAQAFRAFLRQKYGTLDALNARWYGGFWSRNYADWDQVDLPVRPAHPSTWLDWMRYRRLEVTRFVAWQRDLLRGVRQDFVIGSNMPECGPLATAWLGQDFRVQSEGLDYVGTDIYCFVADEYRQNKSMAYSCDFVRSMVSASGAAFWISETPGGPHFAPWRTGFFDGHWGPEFLKDSVEAYVAHGAQRVLFFLWRALPGGQEFGMNGLANMDGSLSERAQAVRAILDDARRQPPAQGPTAYIHHSWDSIALSTNSDADSGANASHFGWYNLLTDLGYRVAYLDDQMLSARQWARGDLLALPYTTVACAATCDAIERAANAGCTVLGGYATGVYNQDGCHHLSAPGGSLRALFGLRIDSIDHMPPRRVEQVCDGIAAGPHLGLASPLDAEVVCRTALGTPLLHRKGQCLYFSFDLGAVYAETGYSQPLLAWFAEATGLRPQPDRRTP